MSLEICPNCGIAGKAVSSETIGYNALDAPVDSDGFHLCLEPKCSVIYFRGEEHMDSTHVRAIPFHKSEDPDRLVCFCFQHSVRRVSEDVVANGESTIREAIKAACKAGDDDCVRRNPQGRCCLGNVGAVIRQSSSDVASQIDDCCSK